MTFTKKVSILTLPRLILLLDYKVHTTINITRFVGLEVCAIEKDALFFPVTRTRNTTVMQCNLLAHTRSKFTLTNEEGYLQMNTTLRTDGHVKSYALLSTGLE